MSEAAITEAPPANVAVERVGSLGLIRLDRPEALNATNLAMIRAVDAALDEFEQDAAVGAVLIEGAGERAFCAGGDIRAIHDSGRAGTDLAETFWREEYRLISRVSRFPKPYVAFMDGIVMGGGVGLAVHGSRRIVTERTRFAMPEVGIGFFPDVGATFILAKAPRASGVYVALTGEPLNAAETIHVGMGDVAVPGAKRAEIKAALGALEPGAGVDAIGAALSRFAVTPEVGPLHENAATIEAVFGHASLEGVLAAAAAVQNPFGAHLAKVLAAKSPTSLKIAIELIARSRTAASLDECLVREFSIARRTLAGHDFYEGVRAAVLDKDRTPCWRPARAEEVDAAAVAAYFAPDDDPLRLPK